jgi:hypothetical protein
MQANAAAMSMTAYDPRGQAYASSQDAVNHSGYAPHPQSAATSFRSFAETNGTSHRDPVPAPQIYTVCMLRVVDDFANVPGDLLWRPGVRNGSQ